MDVGDHHREVGEQQELERLAGEAALAALERQEGSPALRVAEDDDATPSERPREGPVS